MFEFFRGARASPYRTKTHSGAAEPSVADTPLPTERQDTHHLNRPGITAAGPASSDGRVNAPQPDSGPAGDVPVTVLQAVEQLLCATSSTTARQSWRRVDGEAIPPLNCMPYLGDPYDAHHSAARLTRGRTWTASEYDSYSSDASDPDITHRDVIYFSLRDQTVGWLIVRACTLSSTHRVAHR